MRGRRILLPFAMGVVFLAAAGASYLVVTRGDDVVPQFAGSAEGQVEMADIQDWRNFQDFPLFWLGEEFKGLAVTDIIRWVTDADPSLPHPSPENKVILIYGTCEISAGSEGGCAVPLAILIEPLCMFPSAFVPEDVKDGPVFDIRSAEAQWIGPGLVLRSGQVAITIHSAAGDRTLMQRVAESLVSLNSSDVPVPDAPLGPPTRSC